MTEQIRKATEKATAVTMAAVDRTLEKVISRKLTVWIVATLLMFNANIESEHWLYLSALYIGGQSVIDAIVKLKNG